MSPLVGLSGYGGGTSSHTFAGLSYGGTGKWTGAYGYIHGGGSSGGELNNIQKVTIQTTGNATDSGDLTNLAKRACGASSGDYCFNFGGVDDNVLASDKICKWSGTGGNASTFATMTKGGRSIAACCDGKRLVRGGGTFSETGSPNTNWKEDTIEYWDTEDGNVALTDFGNLSAVVSGAAGTNSATRGVFMGSWGSPTNSNEIQYITFQQESNATDFGDLTTPRSISRAAGSETRGVLVGGNGDTDGIEYITFDTTGNATSFGTIGNNRTCYGAGASSDLSRMIFGGGWADGYGDWIEYLTIGTTGNSSDFGDLHTSCANTGGCSGG